MSLLKGWARNSSIRCLSGIACSTLKSSMCVLESVYICKAYPHHDDLHEPSARNFPKPFGSIIVYNAIRTPPLSFCCAPRWALSYLLFCCRLSLSSNVREANMTTQVQIERCASQEINVFGNSITFVWATTTITLIEFLHWPIDLNALAQLSWRALRPLNMGAWRKSMLLKAKNM